MFPSQRMLVSASHQSQAHRHCTCSVASWSPPRSQPRKGRRQEEQLCQCPLLPPL